MGLNLATLLAPEGVTVNVVSHQHQLPMRMLPLAYADI